MNRSLNTPAATLLGALMLAFCGGCGSALTGLVAGTTATNATQKNFLTEKEFADDPTLTASLGHMVAVYLEAEGTHPGDTGSEDGVDEIPYTLTKATTMSLAVPFTAGHGHWIEWCDSNGARLMMARGTQATSRTRLRAGRYLLRVHHTDANNDGETMFIRVATSKRSTSKLNGLAQTRQYEPFNNYDFDDVFCTGANASDTGMILGPDLDEEDSLVIISGNLSCANVVQANFASNFDYEYGLRIVDFENNTRNALFTNCTFENSIMDGSVTDTVFTGCSFVDCDWATFKATGASQFLQCNFKNRDLFNLNVAGTKLSGCDFSGTKMGKGNFNGATVYNCNFTGANFDGAIFDNCRTLFEPASKNTLTGASFAGISVQNVSFLGLNIGSFTTDWSRANFSGCDLTQQTLTGLNLTSAVFVGANLTKVTCKSNATLANDNFTSAKLDTGDFSGSSFSHATLDHADAVATNFSNGVFDGASAHGASFAYSNLSYATFAGAQLGSSAASNLEPAVFTFAYMPNARITDSADCRNVDFSYAHLYGSNASVQGAELSAANFTGAIVSGMDFRSATLESASFENAQAVATNFSGARLNDAKFDNAYLMGADFTNATATSAVFADAAVSTAPCNNNSNCQACNSDSCTFRDLDQANLCCYSFSEPDGTVYAVSFGTTILPDDPSIICPNGDLGPCTGDKLIPRTMGPFPAVPACIPTPLKWCPQPTSARN